MFDVAIAALCAAAIILVVTVLRRRRARAEQGQSVSAAARHVSLVGTIGLVCALLGAAVAILTVSSGVLYGNGRVQAALVPAVGLAFVASTAVGEATWPRPRGDQREVRLTARRLRDLAPVWLVVLVGAYFAGIVLVTSVFSLIASGPRSATWRSGAGLPQTIVPFPGWWYGLPALVASAALVVGLFVCLRMITHRAAVPDVDVEWDLRLRRWSAARVLRGALLALGLTLAGFLAFAGAVLQVVEPFLGLVHLVAAAVIGIVSTGVCVAPLLMSCLGYLMSVVPQRVAPLLDSLREKVLAAHVESPVNRARREER